MKLVSRLALTVACVAALTGHPAHAGTLSLCTGTTGTSPCPLPGSRVSPGDSLVVLAGNVAVLHAASPGTFYADSGAIVILPNGAYQGTGWAWLRVFATASVDNSGMLSNDAFVQLEDDGTLRNQAGGTLETNADFSIYDDGLLVNEGTLHNRGYVYTLIDPSNDPPGDPDNPTIDNRGVFLNHAGADVPNDGDLINAGSFVNPQGASLSNTGRITNSGRIVNDGAITNARYDAAGARIVNSGEVLISATGSLDRGSAVIPAGSYWQTQGRTTAGGLIREALVYVMAGALHGAGPVQSVLRVGDGAGPAAVLSPGDSVQAVATFSVTGSLALGSDARVELDLGGGGAHDQIVTSGPDTLAGELALNLDAGNPPAPSETLTVLTASAIRGTFSAVTLDGAHASWQATVLYEPTRVRVHVAAPVAVEPRRNAPATIGFATLGVGTPRGFSLELPRAARVVVTLVDVGGRQVAKVHDGFLPAGSHEIPLALRRVPSGLYFARARVIEEGGVQERTTRVVWTR